MSLYYQQGGVTEPFAKLMAGLAETLGVVITENRIRSYAKLLGDVAWPDLLRACERAANSSRFFPAVADLRAYIAPCESDSALLAWAGLSRAASEVGAYASVELEDSAAAEALLTAFGSWQAFCEMDDGPALALKRQEFLAAYRAARSSRPARSSDVARLNGRCETPAEMANCTWVARIGRDGHVRTIRDIRRQLEAAGGATSYLEGTDAEAAQGAPRPPGEASQAIGPREGGES